MSLLGEREGGKMTTRTNTMLDRTGDKPQMRSLIYSLANFVLYRNQSSLVAPDAQIWHAYTNFASSWVLPGLA